MSNQRSQIRALLSLKNATVRSRVHSKSTMGRFLGLSNDFRSLVIMTPFSKWQKAHCEDRNRKLIPEHVKPNPRVSIRKVACEKRISDRMAKEDTKRMRLERCKPLLCRHAPLNCREAVYDIASPQLPERQKLVVHRGSWHVGYHRTPPESRIRPQGKNDTNLVRGSFYRIHFCRKADVLAGSQPDRIQRVLDFGGRGLCQASKKFVVAEEITK